MGRMRLIFRETFRLIRNHKVYFLAPILIVLAIIAMLIYSVGPAAWVAFLYAGI